MTGAGNEFKRLPVMRLLMPLVTGIILQYNLRICPLCISISALLLFVSLLLLRYYCSRRPDINWIRGIAFYLFILAVSMGITGNKLRKPSFMDMTAGDSFVMARLVENPLERERTFRVLVKPVAIIYGDTMIKTSGSAIAWFEKDSLSDRLRAGHMVVMPDNFRQIRNNGNPWEFDFRRHAALNGITGEIYLRGDSWFIAGGNFSRSGWQISIVNLRYRLLDVLAQSGISGRELSVASALLLGYRSTIDYETRQIYAGSGAMHILAVSGLHVGILYLLLVWVLGFFRGLRHHRIFAPAIIAALIWFYALLTGLSPSVTRAATMFTFLTISRTSGRPAATLNSLAAAAFFQLTANPFSLFMVGFQLSYLAVAGIVYYQPAIHSLVKSGSRIPDRIGALVSLSVSAQLLIFPLIIYYFNQFPGYFPVTNLFAIPLAMAILYSGLFLFLFTWLEPVAFVLSIILNLALILLNSILNFISNLPFAVIDNIHSSVSLVLVLYAMIFSITLFLKKRKTVYLFLVFLTIITGLGLRAAYRIRSLDQNVFIVYNDRGNSTYNFISGSKNLLISSRTEQTINYNLQMFAAPARKFNANDRSFIPSGVFFDAALPADPAIYSQGGEFVFFAGHVIWFAGREASVMQGIRADRVVFSSRTTTDLDLLLSLVTPTVVIIDSSVSTRQRQRIIDKCIEKRISFWDVSSSGAFMDRLNY
jgi:competence protein ComEC